MDVKDREIVSCKGTRSGILMSILEDEPFGKAMESLKHKIENNESFFAGSPVSLDLGWREIDNEDLKELLEFFKSRNINLLGVISTSLETRRVCEGRGLKVIIGRLGLADHHASHKHARKKTPSHPSSESKVIHADAEANFDEEKTEEHSTIKSGEIKVHEETVMIKKTVRSGQSIKHPGNLVIMGDVNPGAEVAAGGDLVVLGVLRGIAHAGTKNGGLDASITALRFQPTQIKISDQMVNKFDNRVIRTKQPVLARLKNGKIEFTIYG